MTRIVNRVPTLRTPPGTVSVYRYDNGWKFTMSPESVAAFRRIQEQVRTLGRSAAVAVHMSGMPPFWVLEMGCGDARNTD